MLSMLLMQFEVFDAFEASDSKVSKHSKFLIRMQSKLPMNEFLNFLKLIFYKFLVNYYLKR